MTTKKKINTNLCMNVCFIRAQIFLVVSSFNYNLNSKQFDLTCVSLLTWFARQFLWCIVSALSNGIRESPPQKELVVSDHTRCSSLTLILLAIWHFRQIAEIVALHFQVKHPTLIVFFLLVIIIFYNRI